MFTFYTPLFLYITSTNFQNRVITQVHCWGPSQGLEGTGGGEGPWRRNPASLATVGFRWQEPPPPPGHQAPCHLSSCPHAPNAACAPADRPHEVPVHGGLCSLPPGAPPRPAHCPIHVCRLLRGLGLRSAGTKWALSASPSTPFQGGPRALPLAAAPHPGTSNPIQMTLLEHRQGSREWNKAHLHRCAPRGGTPQPATAQPRDGPNSPRSSLGSGWPLSGSRNLSTSKAC